MMYYSCDICDELAQAKEYTLPVKTTVCYNEIEEIVTDKFNLCPDCKNKIANFIGGLIDEFNQ